MKLKRNLVRNDLECPQKETDRWQPSSLAVIRQNTHSNMIERLIKLMNK